MNRKHTNERRTILRPLFRYALLWGVSRIRAMWTWRRHIVLKGAVTLSSAFLVAYLLGIVGTSTPDPWKFAVGSSCQGVPLPSIAVIASGKENKTVIRVDGINRSNPLDSADIHAVRSSGCNSLEISGPGSMQHLFAVVGHRTSENQPYEQQHVALNEADVCRNLHPESTAFVHVDRFVQDSKDRPRIGCHPSGSEFSGPLYTIGGEIPSQPPWLDFSRRGAFVTLSFSTGLAEGDSAGLAEQTRSIVFWVLVPSDHTLLAQRTIPAPTLAMPTSEGTLYKFDVSLLPFDAEGDMGGKFLAGAISFVYESDARASFRDYLVFVLAAVFAFAFERFADSLKVEKTSTT